MARDWLCSQPGCGLWHSEHDSQRDPADDGPEVELIRFFKRWPAGAPRTRVDAAYAALAEALQRKL